ncbi:MAG: PorV/PorQ family protein [Bacteroidota bacterium]
MRSLLLVLVLGTLLHLNAQTTRKYSNEFLNIGVDAAALGMSNAVTAQTANVNSGYWNPAGLVQLEDQQIALMHSSYFANIANYNYIAWAMPIDDRSAVGASLIRFGVDDILDTTQLIDDQGNINYDRISTFSTADYALTVSYARRMPLQGFSYGINAKIIRRIIGDFANSWGFGFDAGLQFTTKNDWKIGIMGRDITTTYNSWSIDEDNFSRISDAIEGQNQELPETTEITIHKLELGNSKAWLFHYDYSLEAAINFNMRFTETNAVISSSFASIDPAFGFQFGYVDLVFLRGGLGNFQNELQIDNSENLTFQPNFGVGFKYKGIQLDYAFTDIGDQSAALYSNVFSLLIDFSVFR